MWAQGLSLALGTSRKDHLGQGARPQWGGPLEPRGMSVLLLSLSFALWRDKYTPIPPDARAQPQPDMSLQAQSAGSARAGPDRAW